MVLEITISLEIIGHVNSSFCKRIFFILIVIANKTIKRPNEISCFG